MRWKRWLKPALGTLACLVALPVAGLALGLQGPAEADGVLKLAKYASCAVGLLLTLGTGGLALSYAALGCVIVYLEQTS